MLRPCVRVSHLPQASGLTCLNELIRWYLSIEDGECQVERDLGLLARVDREHKNGGDGLAEDVLLTSDDSTTSNDVVVGEMAADGAGELKRLGEKGKHWAALWLKLHGRRLGIGRGAARGRPARSQAHVHGS